MNAVLSIAGESVRMADRCSECNRPLRDSVSRARGIGPECEGVRADRYRHRAESGTVGTEGWARFAPWSEIVALGTDTEAFAAACRARFGK